MKPASFEYFAPASLDECVQLLVRHGDNAKLLAGGQSLVPLMNLRYATPSALVDLNGIEDLAYIRESGDGLAIGAMTRHHDVAASELVHQRAPLLARAASLVGYPAIRERGTIGGSLAHADPAAELPCAALALDLEVDAVGPGGVRTIAAADLFVSHFTTTLDAADVVTELRVPAARAGDGWSFVEFSRKTGDFALVAVAAVLRIANGATEHARIAVAGVGERPLRAESVEAALVGQPLAAARDDGVGEAVAAEIDTAARGSADRYRLQLVATLARRALTEASGRVA